MGKHSLNLAEGQENLKLHDAKALTALLKVRHIQSGGRELTD